MIDYLAATDTLEHSRQKAAAPAFVLKNARQVREGQVVLDDIDLEIADRKITALIGPSGAGKTSLLRLLNRLDDAASGEIFYRSRPIKEYPVQELRRRVGFVFQTPNFATPRGFVSGSPSFTFNSSYNREFQLGLRFDF